MVFHIVSEVDTTLDRFNQKIHSRFPLVFSLFGCYGERWILVHFWIEPIHVMTEVACFLYKETFRLCASLL
ncbi:hypothetical protein VCHENC03_1161 [Vibrio sp. HENC-03]|nr:hypothetical protein VCHENC03_1161 [Vibrio sp. HENC-03]